MVDVSGIPNMGFGGGGYFGGIPNQQPAMSAAQINAGIWGNYSPQQAQATQNNIYGPGGFGAQPAYYAGLGAAYGRATGGFGMQPAAAAPAPAADPWAGTGFDPIQYLHNNPDVAGATGGDPMKAYEHARTYGLYEGRGGTDMFGGQGESWSPPQERINQGFDAYPNYSPQSYAPNFNDTFSPYGIYGHQLQNADAINAVNGAFNFSVPRSTDPFSNINNYAFDPIRQTDTGQLFDSIKYLQNNPDVMKSGMSGSEHYNKFGRGEGRAGAWGNAFDPNTYLMNNQDVQQVGMDPRTHYMLYGQKEGRSGGGVINDTRDTIARLLMQGTPSGPNAQGMQGPGGRDYQAWNPMTGGNASVQQLVNQGAGLNMPSGFGGSTYAQNRMYGAPASGYLGIQTPINQDPFSGYRNPADMNAGGGFPADYRQGNDAQPLQFHDNPFGNNSFAGG